ncbi:heavy metal response regulator transcription factor [Fimbriiglobus ruber]|uniref:DNA-binding heavy metal response regulator n=1 Tax=Fimbriiglobus ruber TaxID=1908690 RepID=A0A225DEN1_9BACT|nr:heavy metal response regulator transcription factor [Fimbriiglobus ruber]OWK35609.1 DNA-binding heavy metal response regulator [Fimbriiglobus ruber]
MKLLLVEDDPKTVSFLRKGFSENGFEVEAETNGADGLARAAAGGFDLIVLDVMLPKKDGQAVLRDLRAAGVQTPVLFLTARDGIADKVDGLELGADDYLVKPFAFAELLARVRTVLRRGAARPPDVIRIADLEIDLIRHKAARGGELLDLTPKEFLLLALFARRTGEVLSRDLITEHVWDVKFDHDTNVVDVHVRRLRAKADDPFPAKLIHTVRGVGYVLEVRG